MGPDFVETCTCHTLSHLTSRRTEWEEGRNEGNHDYVGIVVFLFTSTCKIILCFCYFWIFGITSLLVDKEKWNMGTCSFREESHHASTLALTCSWPSLTNRSWARGGQETSRNSFQVTSIPDSQRTRRYGIVSKFSASAIEVISLTLRCQNNSISEGNRKLVQVDNLLQGNKHNNSTSWSERQKSRFDWISESIRPDVQHMRGRNVRSGRKKGWKGVKSTGSGTRGVKMNEFEINYRYRL